jgi:hypothetical protein
VAQIESETSKESVWRKIVAAGTEYSELDHFIAVEDSDVLSRTSGVAYADGSGEEFRE